MAVAVRYDRRIVRDQIDLVAVATQLLGPAPGRRGGRGRHSWWPCPFHDDQNPSFCVTPGKSAWRCFGCGERGDAASLVMRVMEVAFPEAVAYLAGGSRSSGTPIRRSKAPAVSRPQPQRDPSGLSEADALALVAD